MLLKEKLWFVANKVVMSFVGLRNAKSLLSIKFISNWILFSGPKKILLLYTNFPFPFIELETTRLATRTLQRSEI